MADHAPITRRNILSTLAGASLLSAPAAALALPSSPTPAGEASPIAALFARWLELYRVPDTDLPDDDAADALCAKMVVIEDNISAIPARDFQDFALKVAALTNFGGFMIEDRHHNQLFDDARRLIGVGPDGSAAQLDHRQAALDAYRESSSPEDRLQHHLAMAALALDDLCPADNSRWQIIGGGEPRSFNPRFHVARFDPYRDNSDPRLPNGIGQERKTVLFSRPDPWVGL